MAESIIIQGVTKDEKYQSLLPQIYSLVNGERDNVANIGNILAALKYSFHFFWIGLYVVKGNELVLNQFQGPLACTRIAFGKGVCGTAWKQKQVIIVDDVDAFPGHIACSSESKSEIVLPGIDSNGNVKFVLDVDSEHYNCFDKTDEKYLTEIVTLLTRFVK